MGSSNISSLLYLPNNLNNMATIRYNITAGTAPFTVTITPAVHAPQNHSALGNYFFTNIPDNNYTIEVTDSVGCNISFNVSVQCNTTTTTTNQDTTTTTSDLGTTTSTTTVESTTTTTTTTTICPVWFESELSSKLIFSDTLSFSWLRCLALCFPQT